jgi:hypothetical protein
MFFVLIASWFAILFTGKHPAGMFDFILRVFRYIMQTYSYVLLMTDTYPNWASTAVEPGTPSPVPPTLPPASTAPPPPPPPQTTPATPPSATPTEPPSTPPSTEPPSTPPPPPPA